MLRLANDTVTLLTALSQISATVSPSLNATFSVYGMSLESYTFVLPDNAVIELTINDIPMPYMCETGRLSCVQIFQGLRFS